MTQYRLLLRVEVGRQLAALRRAAETQPGGLRDREYRNLNLGLRVLANGKEESFDGKRLGLGRHDLRDCAEIKLAVVQEARYNHDLGPSHRLIYREFEAEDGGLPYREVICFEHRAKDRPFEVAAARLGRADGMRLKSLQGVANPRPQLGPRPACQAAPARQPLTPDLRTALAASSGVAPARGAVNPTTPTAAGPSPPRRSSPPSHERQ